jgi:DNA-binding PucR family transcriptional regulator
MDNEEIGGESEQLIRSVSGELLADQRLFVPIQNAVIAAADRRFGSNPSISEVIEAATLENALHWTTSMHDNPGGYVQPNLSNQVIGIAREGFRWSADGTLRAAYRAGEQAMWSIWMKLAFSSGATPEVLLPALDHASRSLARWVEATSSALTELLDRERRTLFGDEQVRRLELVNLIVGGSPIPQHELERELGYLLSPAHMGVVLFTPAEAADRARLVQVANVISRMTESAGQLIVHASSSSLWLWVAPRVPLTPALLGRSFSAQPDVRIAFGPVDNGVDGFRLSHQRALEVQRLLQNHHTERVAFHTDVAGVLLLAQDERRLREFVHLTLGALVSGAPELRETLRMFIRLQYNATQTSATMFAHRNTVLQRVHRAEQLLPVPLDRNGSDVGLALEALYWLRLDLN